MRIINKQAIIYQALVEDPIRKISAQKFFNSYKSMKESRYTIIKYTKIDLSNNVEYLVGDMYG